MDIKILEAIIAITSCVVLRFVIVNFIVKIQHKYDYSKYRIRPILKLVNLSIFITLIIILIAIWGIEQSNLLTFLSSVFAVVGVALFSEWSILSNVTAAFIIYFSHPVKLGETIIIIDNELNIEGRVSDIGLFYVVIKSDNDEKIMIPNNVFLQKSTKIK